MPNNKKKKSVKKKQWMSADGEKFLCSSCLSLQMQTIGEMMNSDKNKKKKNCSFMDEYTRPWIFACLTKYIKHDKRVLKSNDLY